jgi:hypothetical protein
VSKIVRSESWRFGLARFLVVVSFVWPFFNFNHFFPNATVEIDFLLVFVAIGLLPTLLIEDLWSSLLAVAVLVVAAVWGPPDSALRLLIGVAPCLFLAALYRHFLARGKELVPRGVAYNALLLFVGFSLLQHISFNVFPVIPDWLTNGLTILVPRYMDLPYDEFGARGVQGWASEPSSAAMTCFSFCVVAMQQQPEKRRSILLLFTVLTILNKSVYGMLFLTFLVLACLWEMRRRLRVVSAAVGFALVFAYFATRTNRVTELREHVVIYGLDEESNHELMRFAQILYPLGAFPRMYTPVTFFEHEMQPLGLLPLLVGYGSVFGLLLYYRMIFRSFRLPGAISRPLGLASILLLSFMSSPNFIPAIVAFTYAMTPIKPRETASVDTPGKGWLGRLWALLGASPAVARQDIGRVSRRIQHEIT